MNERQNGFYWVRHRGVGWTVGEWQGDHWSVLGLREDDYYDRDLAEIGTRIQRDGLSAGSCRRCGWSLKRSEGEQALFCENPDCPNHSAGVSR